jgi:hypothetical protein
MVMGSSAIMGMCRVTRSPAFQPGEIPQQGGEFIHPDIELLVGDVLIPSSSGSGHEMDGGLVFVLGQMAVDAVVAGIDLAALEPFPAGCVAGIENLIPVFVPVQQVGILFEAVGEIVQAETFVNGFDPSCWPGR